MPKPTIKTLKEQIAALSEAGVSNKNALTAAVPLIVDAQNHIAHLRASTNELKTAVEELAAQASAYAIAHTSHVFGSIETHPCGTLTGDIEIDGRLFHFAAGHKGYTRIDEGTNLDKSFLAALPNAWTKMKRELDVTAIGRLNVTVDELAECGLKPKENNVWSEKA